MKKWNLEIVVEGATITLTHSTAKFKAVYSKQHRLPQLVLKERSKTDNHELLAEAWKAANGKARELGWIVKLGPRSTAPRTAAFRL